MKITYLIGILACAVMLAGCGAQTTVGPQTLSSPKVSAPTTSASSASPSVVVSPSSSPAPVPASTQASQNAASPTNPLPPSDAQISAVLAQYPASWAQSPASPSFVASRTWEFPNGQGGSLTVVLGEWAGSADGGQNLIFVWNNQQFLGVTTTQWSFDPTISAIPNGFAVTYYQWAASVPFAQWAPNTATDSLTVRYTWDGTQLVPSYTGTIPNS